MMPFSSEDFDPDFAGPGDWAAMYRSFGMQVIPCYNPGEPEAGASWKRPRLSKWTTLQESLVPDASFDRWYGKGGEYANRQNMGILTGRASKNTFVIDLDDHKGPSAGGWWRGILAKHNHSIEPETWRQNTGGGGRQILFQARADWHAPTNRTPIGVDIRGQGGFAVMPSSLHENGKHYTWAPGCAPFEISIAEAPEWLLNEIDILVEQYGGDTYAPHHKAEQTSSPQSDFDDFGNRVDGREGYMAECVWFSICDLYRESPIIPSESQQRILAEQAYIHYERGVRSRLAGMEKTELLEREGRGPSEYWRKWRSTMKKWGTKVAEEANKPRPNSTFKESANQYDEADFDTASAKAEEQSKTNPGALFEYLDVMQIKSIADPRWLVSGMVIEQALGFVFGPPGSLKTFITLSMGLSFAVGMPDWWGRKVERQGAVIYISSEGQSDLKFRIQAWEQKNKVLADDSPFFLIRQTINFMKADDVGKLIATVKAIADKANIPIAAVFVDTVSRVLPGADENLQKDMTLFVAACDAVRQKFNTTVIGVHHTSRSGNMRGSTVFPGAGDFLIEVNREEGSKQGFIKATKIKAAEDGWEQHFKVEEIQLGDIGGHKSLVVESTDEKPKEEHQNGWPDTDVCRQIIAAIDEQWKSGKPWCFAHNSSRYAVANISKRWSLPRHLVADILSTWTANGVIEEGERDTKTHVKGYRVVAGI
jgi:AAA domain/Bifunctional DNA primase/polymerase, N-terminal